MSDLLFISTIVSLIMLIVFFVMGANIGAIKRNVKGAQLRSYRIQYYKALSLEDKEAAYDALFCVVMEQILIQEDGRKHKYEVLKQNYEGQFTELGKDFPAYPD